MKKLRENLAKKSSNSKLHELWNRFVFEELIELKLNSKRKVSFDNLFLSINQNNETFNWNSIIYRLVLLKRKVLKVL